MANTTKCELTEPLKFSKTGTTLPSRRCGRVSSRHLVGMAWTALLDCGYPIPHYGYRPWRAAGGRHNPPLSRICLMSALGQKRTSEHVQSMSALPLCRRRDNARGRGTARYARPNRRHDSSSVIHRLYPMPRAGSWQRPALWDGMFQQDVSMTTS